MKPVEHTDPQPATLHPDTIPMPYAYKTPKGVKRSFDARPPKMFYGLDAILGMTTGQ